MRKADYAALAALFRKKIQYYTSIRDNALTDARRLHGDTMLLCTQDIAQQASEVLSVDKAAFQRASGILPDDAAPMSDNDKLARMRQLGVVWAKNKTLPRYPAGMSADAKREADALYDSMADSFVDAFGPKHLR